LFNEHTSVASESQATALTDPRLADEESEVARNSVEARHARRRCAYNMLEPRGYQARWAAEKKNLLTTFSS